MRQTEAIRYHCASSKRKNLIFLSKKVGFDSILQEVIEKSLCAISLKYGMKHMKNKQAKPIMIIKTSPDVLKVL